MDAIVGQSTVAENEWTLALFTIKEGVIGIADPVAIHHSFLCFLPIVSNYKGFTTACTRNLRGDRHLHSHPFHCCPIYSRGLRLALQSNEFGL